MAHPFLLQDVLWMHTAQHRDLRFYLDLVRQAKATIPSSGEDLPQECKNSLAKVERGWYYLFNIILTQHDEAEDKVLLPALTEADPSAQAQAQAVLSQHMELEKKRADIAGFVKEVGLAPSPAVVEEVLARLEASVADFATFYKNHTADEEKMAKAVATQHMTEEQQTLLVNRLNGFYTTTQEGRIHIMLVREEVLKDPKKEEWYNATLPAMVRNVLAPTISNLDPGCLEYWHLFHPTAETMA